MIRSAAPWLRPFGLLTAIALAMFAGAAPAVLANDTPGNNGTAKIHEGAGENDPDEVRNEPQVCTFHLHFYFADPVQTGTWQIEEWAPTGENGSVVLSGTYDTQGDGEDRQPEEGVYTLPDGHYKLFWDGDLDTAKHDKMKVFWVECGESTASPNPVGSELPAESASAAPTETASASPTDTATPTGSELPVSGVGSPPPTGEVEAIAATPGITPPPTDLAADPQPASDGWRVVVMTLAALITAAVVLSPSPRAVREIVPRRSRSR